MVAGLFYRSSYVEAVDFLSHQVGGALPALILLFIVIEWLGREQQYALAKFGLMWPRVIRWSFYYALIITMIVLTGKEQQFIYFQF